MTSKEVRVSGTVDTRQRRMHKGRRYCIGNAGCIREDVGCGGNEDIEMLVWSHKTGQNRKLNIRGTTKVEVILKVKT